MHDSSLHQLVATLSDSFLSWRWVHWLPSSTCNYQFAVTTNLHFFVFTCVQNLQNVLCNLIFGCFCNPSLEQHFDITQFSKVEITFFVQSIVLEFQLLYLCFKLGSPVVTRRECFCSRFGSWRHRLCRSCRLSWNRSRRCPLRNSWFWTTHRCNFSSSRNVVKILSLSPSNCIVWLTVIIFFEVSFEPLTKL